MLDLLASRIPLVTVHSAVFDQMLDSIASYERDGTIVYINPAACRHIGASSEQLVGKRNWELFPEARGTAFHQAFEHVANTGNSDQFEHFYPPRGRWYANQIYLANNLVWAALSRCLLT